MKTSTMTQRRYYPNQRLSMIILLASIAHTIAVPYMALTPKGHKKCVVGAYPKGAKLTIEYDFIDFEEAIQNADILISIRPVQPEGTSGGFKGHIENISRHDISQASGKIRYNKDITHKTFTEHDLEVCVETEHTRKKLVVLFSLKLIEEQNEVREKDFLKMFGSMRNSMKNIKDGTKDIKTTDVDQTLATDHMSYLEKTILDMASETELLIGSARIKETEEAAFSMRSYEMHAAAKCWPILHLLVLFVTGYTQANHVVRFFKSRHII